MFTASNKLFILLFGTDGVNVSRVDNNVLSASYNIAYGDNKVLIEQVVKFLNEKPDYPLKIIFEIKDQYFDEEEISAINRFEANKVLSSKLARMREDYVYSGYFESRKLSGEGFTKRYIFVSALDTEITKLFFEYIYENVNNSIYGVYSFVSEMMPVLDLIGEKFVPLNYKNYSDDELKKISFWQIFCIYSKNYGLRIITLKNNDYFLTVAIDSQANGDVNKLVEDETINIIRKLGVKGDDKIDVFIISDEVTGEMLSVRLKADNVFVINNKSLQNKLGLEKHLLFNSYYLTDSLLAYLSTKFNTKSLYHPKISELIKAESADKILKNINVGLISGILSVLLIFFSVQYYNEDNLSSLKYQLLDLNSLLNNSEIQIDKYQKDEDITELLPFYRIIRDYKLNPILNFKEIASLRTKDIHITEIRWENNSEETINPFDITYNINFNVDYNVNLKMFDDSFAKLAKFKSDLMDYFNDNRIYIKNFGSRMGEAQDQKIVPFEVTIYYEEQRGIIN